MMRVSSLLSLPVYSNKTGKKIGHVKDIMYSPSQDSIVGYVINGGVFFKSLKFIAANDVLEIRKDCLIVEDDGNIQDIDEKFANNVRVNSQIIGSNIKDVYGKNIGIVSDTIVDTKDNKVKGYILSDGLINDLINGRSFVAKSEDVICNGSDVVITRR